MLKNNFKTDNRPRYLRYGQNFNRQDTSYQDTSYKDTRCRGPVYRDTICRNFEKDYSDQYYDNQHLDAQRYNDDDEQYSTKTEQQCLNDMKRYNASKNQEYNRYNNTKTYDTEVYNGRSYDESYHDESYHDEPYNNARTLNVKAFNAKSFNDKSDKSLSDRSYDNEQYNDKFYQRYQARYNNECDNNNRYSEECIIPNSNIDISYKKRQLPQLQRYTNLRYEQQYQNEHDDYPVSRRKDISKFSFSSMWQKIVITFTSILSLICLTWVAYNWSSSKNSLDEQPAVVEPDHPSFKVLPDNVDNENIPYQDKSVYSRVDPSLKLQSQENVIPQPEIPNDIESCKQCKIPAPEEYSFVDDNDYYIKCETDKNTSIANTQLSIMKKKLKSFPNTALLTNVNCNLRTVVNKSGNQDQAVLIGPFNNMDNAVLVAQHCAVKGNIITVKKKNS